MESNKKFAGLEITSKVIRLLVGFTMSDQVYILHSLESKIDSIANGMVLDADSLASSIRGLVDVASETLNMKINELIVALPPMAMSVVRESCSTNTISQDDIVAEIDINNAISLLRKIKFSPEDEIVDIIPYQYVLENRDISDIPPIDKLSKTLTVHASIYAMNSSLLQGYRSAIQKAKLTLKHFVIAPYAAAIYLQGLNTIPSNYFLLNVGDEITTLSQISQKKNIVQNECFKFGSSKLTENISKKFNLSLTEAKALKETYGMDQSPSYTVYIAPSVQLNDLKEVIKSSLDPLFTRVNKILQEWVKEEGRVLPLVTIGGGCKLKGFDLLLSSYIDYEMIDYHIDSFGARDKANVVALGLIKYGDLHLSKDIDEGDFNAMTTNISRIDKTNKKETSKVEFDFDNEL